MKRYALLAAAIVLFASSAIAQAPPPDAQAPAAPPQARRTIPPPTNLQVLPKDISTQDLIKLMRGYSAALGVHCNFCHEVNEQTHHSDFAADTKPEKASARTMIAMTREINDKYLSQIKDPDAPAEMKVVTCGTCHRGNTMPEPFTPKPESK